MHNISEVKLSTFKYEIKHDHFFKMETHGVLFHIKRGLMEDFHVTLLLHSHFILHLLCF